MKRLLYAGLLLPAIALATPTVQQVESAIQSHRYVDAEVMLEQVTRDNPDSAKAHYYLGQIYNINGQPVDGKNEIAKYYAMQPKLPPVVTTPSIPAQEHKPDTSILWFMLYILLFVGITFTVITYGGDISKKWKVLKQWLYNCFYADRIAKELDKRNSALLTKCIAAKKGCRSSMTMLKVNGLQDTEIYDAFNELHQACVDAIECLTKGGDFDITGIETMLRDIETWNHRLDTEMSL